MRIHSRTALSSGAVFFVSLGLLTGCISGGGITPPVTSTVGAVSPSPAVLTPTTAPGATETAPMPGETPTTASTAAATPGSTEMPPTQPAETPTSAAGEIPTDTVSAFPDPNGFVWSPVVSGLAKPLDLTFLPDGSGTFLVLEQVGTIRVVQNGSVLPDPFLDITDRVGSGGSEQGLLGIALHPDYANNGFFYVNYTDQSGDTVIARFTRSGDDPNKADSASEKVLLQVDQPYANHNGGSMVFGPDGYLYMGLGDGGSAGDPQGNGQSLDTRLGKLLRVDVNNSDPYAIPADNPFAQGGTPEIWVYGLRNPWRFSFDRLTGDLYIGDVGQNEWEEIDFSPAGSAGGTNFGWDFREGTHPYEGTPPADASLTDPIFEYAHGEGCSVTGGYVYRGQALPEFRGIYLFADYCSGRLWGSLHGADGAWQTQLLFSQTGMNITSFGQDGQGEIYLVNQQDGGVYRLQRK